MCLFPWVVLALLFVLFPLCGLLALGVLNWSTAQVSLFLFCVLRHFLRCFGFLS